MGICNLYKKEIENTFKFCTGSCGISDTSVGESNQNKENKSCCQSCWNIFATACVVFLIGVFFIPLLLIWSISICLKTCNGDPAERLLRENNHDDRYSERNREQRTRQSPAYVDRPSGQSTAYVDRPTESSRTPARNEAARTADQAKASKKNANRPNFAFYKNQIKAKPNGEYISTIHSTWMGNYNELEGNHNFIQWLFPIKEQGVNYYASPITDDEIAVMKVDMEIVQRLLISFDMMLDFYGLTRVGGMESKTIKHARHWEDRYHNINKNVHNNLRITRIIKCLCLFDLDELAAEFVKVLAKDILIDKKLPRCERSLRDFWLQSLPTKHEDSIRNYIDGLKAEKQRKHKEDVCAVKSSSVDGHQEIASQEEVLVDIGDATVKKEVTDKNKSFEGRGVIVSTFPTADKSYTEEKNATSAADDKSFHSVGGNPEILVDIYYPVKNESTDKNESFQGKALSTSPTDKSNVKENVTSAVTDTSFHSPVGSVFDASIFADSVNGNNVPASNGDVESYSNVEPTFAASSADVESGSDVRPAGSADVATLQDKLEKEEPMEVDDVEAQTAKL